MSRVFDVVDLKRASRSDQIFAGFHKTQSVFDAVGRPPAPPPPLPLATSTAKPDFPAGPRVVYAVWLSCVVCLSLPFLIGLFAEAQHMRGDFPYSCGTFFLSLVVGLPGASVHLFCCSLCLYTRNRPALVLYVASIFAHILAIEFACGVSAQSNVAVYLLSGSVYAGVFSQILIVETLRGPRSTDRSHLATGVFSLLLVSATSAVVTGLVCDVFHVQLQPERKMYAQYAPLVASVVAYSASTALTLKPVFQVIQALSSAGL